MLVEDSKKVQNYNNYLLSEQGFDVITAMTLAEAETCLETRDPDAIILDIGMPDGSGLDFLRELRRISRIPVLLLTGFGESKDIVLGFETGCDDYLTKPYTFEVLLVRLLRLIQGAEQVPEIVTKGLLTLKLIPREAYVNGKNLLLTPKFYSLLQFLIQNENRMIGAEKIYEAVWGRPMAGNSQALHTAVSRLRSKLKGCGYTITTGYGNGYRFERDAP